MLALSATSTNLFSQQERLIKPSTETVAMFSASEQQSWGKIQEQDLYSDIEITDFESLVERQDEGRIRIDLPNDNCGDLIYKVQSVRYENEDDYEWYGVLESTASPDDCECRTGALTMISSEHGKIAHIIIDDLTYEILSLSENRYAIGKIDDSKFTKEECGVADGAPNSYTQPTEPVVENRTNGNCNVRCLVLFSPAALTLEGSLDAINNRVNLAIMQTNQALRNSDIDRCELRILNVGVLPTPFGFAESSSMGTDVSGLAMNPTVMTMRDDAEADIVMILTNGALYAPFGIVDAIGPINAQAFSIVQAGAATTGRFTFAHEVAHLFGGGHNTDPRSGIPHAHKFKTGDFVPCVFGKKQRTILHTLEANKSRIQYFSNPDVWLSGQSTGKSGKKDNAQQLKNTACTVATFRETIEPFSLGIGGDSYACPCNGVSVTTNIFNGTAGATYIYTWEESIDGINWTTLPYTGPNASVSVSCAVGNAVQVRVSVIGSDGNVGNNQTQVFSSDNWPGQVLPCNLSPNFGSGDNKSTFSIFPNPAYNQFAIEFQPDIAGIYSLFIRDAQGRIVQTIIENESLEVGKYKYTPTHIQKGIYFIHSIDEAGNHQIQKLLKL